jgi:hypothetical protein
MRENAAQISIAVFWCTSKIMLQLACKMVPHSCRATKPKTKDVKQTTAGTSANDAREAWALSPLSELIHGLTLLLNLFAAHGLDEVDNAGHKAEVAHAECGACRV